MSSPELDNLARIGKLKREPPADEEIAGLLSSATERLLAEVIVIAKALREALSARGGPSASTGHR